jgi:hypothetical protein
MMIIRIILLLISAILIISGLIAGNKDLSIAGAFVFTFICLIDLPLEYKRAKLYRDGKFKPSEIKTKLEILENRFRQGMLIFSFVLMAFHQTSGGIIFGSAIISYFFSGLITKEVAGIPLEMGYGGWRKRNFRRRR